MFTTGPNFVVKELDMTFGEFVKIQAAYNKRNNITLVGKPLSPKHKADNTVNPRSFTVL